jgi:hypothetical protein
MGKYEKKKLQKPLLFIIICIAVILLLLFLFRSCNNSGKQNGQGTETSTFSDKSPVQSEATGDTTSDLQAPEIGSIIVMGTYEQDNDLDKGTEEISWIVIAVEDGKALLLSESILDVRPYAKADPEYEHYAFDVTWENCELRGWLNSEFFKEAFNQNEQNSIASVLNINEGKVNPHYGPHVSPVQKNTQDKVFLLSVEQVLKYLTEDAVRRSKPTQYCMGKGILMNEYCEVRKESVNDDGCALWWLRTPGYQNEMQGDCAVIVSLLDSKYQEEQDNSDSFLLNDNHYQPVHAIMNYAGTMAGADWIGVRPVIWIQLEP